MDALEEYNYNDEEIDDNIEQYRPTEYKNYYVSNHGNVKNITSNKILTIRTTKSGTSIVGLKVDGNSTQRIVHDLVMKSFKPLNSITAIYKIKHINNNLNDNHLNNLMYDKRSLLSNRYSIENTNENEIYTQIDDSYYYISNYGNVLNKQLNRLLVGNISPGEYYRRIKISYNHTCKAYYVHKLVAEKFVINDTNYKFIRHINGDTLDNRAENLEYSFKRVKYTNPLMSLKTATMNENEEF